MLEPSLVKSIPPHPSGAEKPVQPEAAHAEAGMALNTESVCVVVLTYDRKVLLEQCLAALEQQSYPIADLVLVDNASTDGSLEMVKSRFPWVRIYPSAENLGASAGFYRGIEEAVKLGHKWLWIMDDDCIPLPNALHELVVAYQTVPYTEALASRVLWTDKTIHPMNDPISTWFHFERQKIAQQFDLVSIRCTSFVSFFVSSRAVGQCGLPLKDYTIWNDDVEFTARISQHIPMYLVRRSVVVHASATKYMPHSSTGSRFFYEVRNKLWILFYAKASWSLFERFALILVLLWSVGLYLYNNKFSPEAWQTIGKGWQAARNTKPNPVQYPTGSSNHV
jgi:rhamnopyranosyl-N-acetylglucosaminyl-diphospho-decaprenol beta-1,3/1,4-galactofuranosyltransferase